MSFKTVSNLRKISNRFARGLLRLHFPLHTIKNIIKILSHVSDSILKEEAYLSLNVCLSGQTGFNIQVFCGHCSIYLAGISSNLYTLSLPLLSLPLCCGVRFKLGRADFFCICILHTITKTYLYNFDPLNPTFI